MITLKILGSSSSGNCCLLVTEGRYYLIDAGFSGKKIREKLSRYGISLKDISGVFITHEHQDHVQGLKALAKIEGIKFYANYKTAQAIESRYDIKGPWCVFETAETFSIDNLSILPFLIPHDAAEPVGFLFKTQRNSCVWATDLGRISPQVAQVLEQADVLVLEANHDAELLWNHPDRPVFLKERIAGEKGHLSNYEAFSFIKNSKHAWKSIYLAHISKDCNSVQQLQQLFLPLAQSLKFDLEIVDPVLES